MSQNGDHLGGGLRFDFPVHDREQMRDVALAAEVYLRIDSARLYGFVQGGPEINVERCEEAIAAAKRIGATYTDDDIERAIREILAADNPPPQVST